MDLIKILFVIAIITIAGCSDGPKSPINMKAWVKPVNGETCASEYLKKLSVDYGKEVSAGFGDACFLRTSIPTFALYSPETMTVRRIVIDKENCTDQLLKDVKESEGAEFVISACANAGTVDGVKSSGKQW